jgi:hypothetical protein
MKLLLLFAVLQLVNVALNTVKTVITVKGTPLQSALINAITFGVYTVVVVYTASDIYTLQEKIIVTVATNLIAVYFVKVWERKLQKDKIWKIEIMTDSDISAELVKNKLPFFKTEPTKGKNYFTIFAYTQTDTATAKNIISVTPNTKYFITEERAKL